MFLNVYVVSQMLSDNKKLVLNIIPHIFLFIKLIWGFIMHF